MWAEAFALPSDCGSITCVKFSPDGLKIAASSSQGTLLIINSLTFAIEKQSKAHGKGINQVCWSKNSKALLTCSDDGTLLSHRSTDLEIINRFVGHFSYVTACDISPNLNRVVSGSFDESLRIWDFTTGKVVRVISAHSDPISSVCFNRDGKFILSSSTDGACRLWETFSGNCVKTFLSDNSRISFSCLTPNDRYILMATMNSEIKLISVSDRSKAGLYVGHVNTQRCIFCGIGSFTDKDKVSDEVFSASEDGNAIGWDLHTGEVKWKISCGLQDGVAVDMDPSGMLFATGGGETEKTLRIWKRNAET